jgi:voltage-gated potassium channel
LAIKDISPSGRIILVLVLLISVTFFGTLGFYLIEGWPLFDSFYMTLTTIATIGYGEIHPLSLSGRIFNSIVIILGVGVAAYTFMTATRFIIEGELQNMLGKRRLDRKIMKLDGHYIICGNGRIGSLVWKEFQKSGKPFVVVDSDPQALEILEKEHIPFVFGDATQEETLERAGISRAKGLIATAVSDVSNVYITLISKELNPKIFVLARAETEDSIRNLKRAGADRVVSPYLIGGQYMANIILKPTIMDLLDLAAGERNKDISIQMEGFKIKHGSLLIGTQLKDSRIRKDIGLVVVTIKNPDGNMIFNPPADYVFQTGDILVCIGEDDALEAMKKLSNG